VTFLATSREFLAHDATGHPETAARLRAILDHLDKHPALKGWDRIEPDGPATDEELLAVHTRRLLLAVQGASASAPSWLDPDTYVVEASERCARLAARLTVQAAQRALDHDEAGLVLVRPPGHHATPDRSMGFCLYNNVAIAAQRMLDAKAAQRVLVFDHDVHHGNGTQDAFYGSPDVLYQSFHLGNHYPGTGAADETGTGAGEGYTMNAPLALGDGEPEVRALMDEVFLPTARAFRPDLVLVSAGYDSLEGDPLGGLRLTPPFFGEMVQRLLEITPRVVAVLEGGYQLHKIPLAAEWQARALGGERIGAPPGRHAPACLAPLAHALRPQWRILESSVSQWR